MTPHQPPAARPPPAESTDSSFTRTSWLAVVLAMISTAIWVGWPAMIGVAPLEPIRLAISCALAGAASLLVITVIEMRVAPWRFMQ